jgi:outer membrane autotransporter protein
VDVAGTAFLNGAEVRLTLPELTTDWKEYPWGTWKILSADKVEGKFSLADYLFLVPDLRYIHSAELGYPAANDGTNRDAVWLNILRKEISLSDLTKTANQRALARGLESLGENDPLYREFLLLRRNEENLMLSLYDNLSGDIYPSLSALMMDMDRNFGRNIRARFHKHEGALPVWAGVSGDMFRRRSDGNAGEISRQGAEFQGGTDIALGNFYLGAALRGGIGGAQVPDRKAGGTLGNLGLGIYGGGSWRAGPGDLRAGGALGYGLYFAGVQRTLMSRIGGDTLEGNYTSQGIQILGDLGWAIRPLDWAEVEPYFGLSWNSLITGGFHEKSRNGTSTAALNSPVQHNGSLGSTLGVRFRAEFFDRLELDGELSWQHLYGDTAPVHAMSLAGGKPFEIRGAPGDHDSGILRLGAGYAFTPQSKAHLGYQMNLGGGGGFNLALDYTHRF